MGQDRHNRLVVVETTAKIRKVISVSHDAGHCLTGSGTISFSERNLLHGVSFFLSLGVKTHCWFVFTAL